MTERQWKNYYGEETPEEVFNEHWHEYQSNGKYNLMYRAYTKCKRILEIATEWGEKWVEKYIYDPTKHIVERITKIVKRATVKVRKIVRGEVIKSAPAIDWNGIKPQTGNQFYLVELLNSLREVVWPKFGTTIRPSEVRFGEHIGNKQPKSYADNDVSALKVIGIWNCGDIDPVEVESKVRSYLKRKYGVENYVKNDRFDCELDYDDLKSKIPDIIHKLQEIEVY